MSVDFNSAGLLLHIIEKCAQNPRLSSLAGAANVELDKLNVAAKNDLDERAAEIRKNEQAAQPKVLVAAVESEPSPTIGEPITSDPPPERKV